MNKKWLITIGVVLGIIALGVAAYFAWQNRRQIAEVIPGMTGNAIPGIEKTESKLNVLSSRSIKSFWVAQEATSTNIFYLDNDKNIFKIDDKGVEIADTTSLKGITEVVTDKSGNLVLGKKDSEGGTLVFDVLKNKSLGDFFGVDEAAWGAEKGMIAMLVSANDEGFITPSIEIGNMSDTKPFTTLISGQIFKGFGLQWPQKDALYLTQQPSAEYISDLWKLDIKTKTLKKIMSDRGLSVKWSPFGDRGIAFTTSEGRAHKLTLIDSEGNRLKEFKFVTLPEKCVMATASQIYCAIPRDQEALSHMILPDDYLKRSVYTKDGIYQIDIDKDSIRGIFEDETPNIDATDLTVMDNRLLFINRYDGKLYGLNLQ